MTSYQLLSWSKHVHKFSLGTLILALPEFLNFYCSCLYGHSINYIRYMDCESTTLEAVRTRFMKLLFQFDISNVFTFSRVVDFDTLNLFFTECGQIILFKKL